MASSDDEDVARAIALSLGQPDPANSAAREVISLDSDNEDSQNLNAAKGPVSTSSGILGLDRGKMEAERLARKRKATSPVSDDMPERAARHVNTVATKAMLSSGTIRSSISALNGMAGSGDLQSPDCASQPKYHTGKVFKTWVKGQPRNGDVTIREVLQPETLQLAVLSSFQWDVPWLFSHLRPETKTTLVMQAKDDAIKVQYRSETADAKNLRLCFPSMEGQINCMHSKLMLLSYADSLRIVVPTANLVPYDWGEHGTMENTVWMVDLPRLSDHRRLAKDELTEFGRELVRFLAAKGLDTNIIDSVCGFDFSGTKDVAFVHTIGGAHSGTEWRHTGHGGLASAIKDLGLSSAGHPVKVDFVTSSMGSLNTEFLGTIYRACQGTSPLKEYADRIARKAGTKAPDSDASILDSNFRIYFPTNDTVTSSIAGHAGTICIQSSYYNNPKFPRQLLRNCKSNRKGVLMHNKIIYVRPEGTGRAWAYIGSANCSESAWGSRLVKDKITKGPKMNCRNWECGVLVKCDEVADGMKEGMGVFEGIVPVPMEWPGEEYRGRKPWYFLGEH